MSKSSPRRASCWPQLATVNLMGSMKRRIEDSGLAHFTEEAPASVPTSEEEAAARARLYARQRYVLALCSLLLGLAYLLAMVFFGSKVLRTAVANVANNIWVQVLLYSSAFLVLYNLIALPLSFYSGYVTEHRFGLSRQNLASWLSDWFKKMALSLLLLLPIVEVIYFFLRHFPNYWWLFGSITWILFAVILARLTPTVLLPLFYKIEPIEAPEVRSKLSELMKDTQMEMKGIYRFNLSRETRKATAALAGWGRTRRVLLADTLLDAFTPEEIQVVFAHELGHYVRGHIPRLLIWSSVFSVLGFFFCKLVLLQTTEVLYRAEMLTSPSVSDIATLPLFCLIFSLFGLVVLPLQNAYSRKLETEADLYALHKTGAHRAFISALSKLTARNLLERAPSRLVELIFYSHPPVEKRIRLAYRLLKQQQTGGR